VGPEHVAARGTLGPDQVADLFQVHGQGGAGGGGRRGTHLRSSSRGSGGGSAVTRPRGVVPGQLVPARGRTSATRAATRSQTAAHSVAVGTTVPSGVSTRGGVWARVGTCCPPYRTPWATRTDSRSTSGS